MRAPDYRLTLDGADLTPRVRPRLATLTLTEKRGEEADQLDLVLTDDDGRLALPRTGAEIRLELGWRGSHLVDKGAFIVDEIEHAGAPDLLTLRARSADFTSRLRTRREASWRDTTLGQVVRELASRQGLQARVSPELEARELALVDQGRESDAALLRRLGREHDAVATIKSGRLIFAPVGSGQTAGGSPLPDFTITRAHGDQHRWTEAERDAYSGVEVAWHDTDGAGQQTVVAGDGDNPKRVRRTYGSEASARRAAEAEWARVQRGKATLAYTLAHGRPDLYPEQTGRVLGIKPAIDAAEWRIEELRHSLGDAGLTTALSLETAE